MICVTLCIFQSHNSNHLWKTREVVRWSGHFQPGWCHLLISDQCLVMVSKGILKQPTSLNPQIPLELRWKRWWKPSILRPLEVSERPLRRDPPSFWGKNTNALHEWGILQRKHTTDIVGLWMMRQISLSQMFWSLKDCGSQSSRWLGWMYTDMHTCKTCTGTHVSQPYHHINININTNTNINIYIKRNIIISIV